MNKITDPQLEKSKNQEQPNTIYNPSISFRLDGLVFEDLDGSKRVSVPNIEDETIKEQRLKQAKTYYVHQNLIYVTNEAGEIHVVPNTQSELRNLFEAGYTFSTETTNFLDETQPTTFKDRIRFLEFKLKVEEQILKENLQLHLSIYAEKAESMGLKDVVDGLFLKIDGIEFNNLFIPNESQTIPFNTDGKDFRLDRLRSVGYYDSNNGKLCYVGRDGSMYLGANSPENIKALTLAGYRPGNIFVPFSNGETPINEDTRQIINDVCTGKKPEELKAERLARVVNFSSTNKRLFGTLPSTSNEELMKVFSDLLAESQFNEANRLERQRLIELMRTETDQFGRTLKIYSINGREIVFRGREELPETETLNSGNVILVGEKPVNLPENFYNTYEKKVTSNQIEGQQTILAVKNLRGVLETVVLLGLKDEKILTLLEEIKNGIYSQRAIEMVDALIAMNFFSNLEGMFLQSAPDMETDSEIIFIHALLGNQEAQKYVTRRLIQYQAYSEDLEERRKEEFRKFYGKYKNEALKVQELCIVHSTRYEPRREGEGLYSIPTTFDATKGEYLRNSIHLTLNHKVHSHLSGNWEQNGFTIISPLSDTLAVNGDPEGVNFDDTWWLMNPGQRFQFRGATVIAFSTDTNGELIQFDENLDSGMVRLKPIGYDARDLRTIMSMETLRYDRTTELFTDMITGYISRLEYDRGQKREVSYKKELDEKLKRGEITYEEYERALNQISVARINNDGQDEQYNFSRIFNASAYSHELKIEISEAVRQSLETSEGQNMEEIAEKLVRDTRIVERINDSVRQEVSFDLEDTILTMIEYIASEGESRVSSLLSRIATEQTLERRGFQVARTTSENNGYGLGSGFSGSEVGLSTQLGSRVGRHDGTPESNLVATAYNHVARTFKKRPWDPEDKILPNLRPMVKKTFINLETASPTLRRIIYVSGLTPSYVGSEFEFDSENDNNKIVLPEVLE